MSAASTQNSVIRDNGYPNFEEIMQGDISWDWELKLSSLPTSTRYASYYASSEDAAARFSLEEGKIGLVDGEWALNVMDHCVELWLNPGGAVHDDEQMAALIARATGATWVGVCENSGLIEDQVDMHFDVAGSFYGWANYYQDGDWLNISVYKGSYEGYPDFKGDIVAEYTF